jgi:hypothetical protein
VIEASADHLDIKDRREHRERAAEFMAANVKDINGLLLRMPRCARPAAAAGAGVWAARRAPRRASAAAALASRCQPRLPAWPHVPGNPPHPPRPHAHACRPLLLLLKTNDCLRAVDSALGQPINTLVITARQCTRALAEERVRAAPGLGSRLAAAREQLQVEVVIGALLLASWWARLKAAWWRQRPPVVPAASPRVA